MIVAFSALLSGCKAERSIESKILFSSGNQSEVSRDEEISGEYAALIIKSYSTKELMLPNTKDYSIFISSETALYDNENYYKVVAGKAVKNSLNYYNIEEIGCFLVSLDGKKIFSYDEETGFLIPLNIIRDIVA